jgi:hypothetical protein
MNAVTSNKLAGIVRRNRAVLAHDLKWAVLMATGLVIAVTTLLPL